MYSEDDILAEFSLSSLHYLRNKCEGGSNNLKGNSYENHLAVYKIACLSANVIEDAQNIILRSQILAFVDDFIIDYVEHSSSQHFQLKSGQMVSWGEGDRSIYSDFSNQKKLNDSKSKQSQIIIRLFGSEPQLDPQVKVILDKITKFQYKVSKGLFHWEFGGGIDKGTLIYSCETPDFRRFE